MGRGFYLCTCISFFLLAIKSINILFFLSMKASTEHICPPMPKCHHFQGYGGGGRTCLHCQGCGGRMSNQIRFSLFFLWKKGFLLCPSMYYTTRDSCVVSLHYYKSILCLLIVNALDYEESLPFSN